MSDVKVIITGDASGLEREAGRARSALAGIGDVAKFALGNIVAQAATTAASAIGDLAAKSIGMAADYERSMHVLQAVTGATDAQMEKLRQKAIELGDDITLPGVSAVTATDAMIELAKAGLSAEQSMAAARGTLQLAAAGQVDAAYAAEVVAGALNAFALSGDQATRVADLLAAAANASAAGVTDMAYAMQMANSVGSLTGQSIHDLVTAIAMMANAGIKGQDAGTSLKVMMMRLVQPTEKAAELLKRLGISVYDADGNIRPLPDLVSQFSHALSGLDQSQRAAALSTIFGADAIRAASIVLAAGRESYDAMAQAVSKQGAASDLAGAQMKGLSGAIEGLKSNFETLMIKVGTPFLEPLSRALRAVGEIITSPSVSGAISGLAQSIATGFGNAVSWVVANWPTISATVQSVIASVKAVVQNVLAPVGQSVINALQPAIDWVSANWPTISATIGKAVSTVRTMIETALPAIVPVFQMVSEWVRTIIEGVLIPALDGILSKARIVVDWVSANWPLISATAQTVFQAVSDVVNAVLPPIVDLVGGMIKSLSSLIDGGLNAILGIIRAIMQAIQGDWQGAWESVKGAAESLWGGIKGFFAGLPAQLADIGRQMIQGLASGVSQAAGAVRSAVEGAISSAIAAAKSALGIRSPSRVFAGIGRQSGAGFIAGLESMMRDVDATVSMMVQPPQPAPSYSYATTNNYNYVLNVESTRAMDDLTRDYRLMMRR